MSLAVTVAAASSLLFLVLLALCFVGMVRRRNFAFPFLFLAIAFLVIAGVSISSILERVIGFVGIDKAEEYAEILIIPFILLFTYAWSAAERLERNRAYVGELHHRVKNNLQVVESLLDLQTDESEGEAREALVAARSRASIIGLTERMAMESGELDDLDMGAYLRAVIQKTLAAELDAELDAVSRQYRVDCPELRFGPATALPCGLIATELLLADFPARNASRAERVIRLTSTGQGRVRLSFH
ncbi:MAG: sensor histidine kinase, partial [Spirochaetaceae bacterium]|nr:sensor histidine kinase [Spirochaetaceae bacterium]